jgi:hypothetical protein
MTVIRELISYFPSRWVGMAIFLVSMNQPSRRTALYPKSTPPPGFDPPNWNPTHLVTRHFAL